MKKATEEVGEMVQRLNIFVVLYRTQVPFSVTLAPGSSMPSSELQRHSCVHVETNVHIYKRITKTEKEVI